MSFSWNEAIQFDRSLGGKVTLVTILTECLPYREARGLIRYTEEEKEEDQEEQEEQEEGREEKEEVEKEEEEEEEEEEGRGRGGRRR